MTTPQAFPPVDLLVLARVLAGGEKGATISTLTKDVGALLEHRLARPAIQDRITRSLDAMAARGLVELARTKKGTISKVVLSDAGRRSVLEALGYATRPSRLTWDALKKGPLAAMALGLPIPKGEELKNFSTDPGYKAALLRSVRTLPIDRAFPSKKQAENALFWRLLGIESDKEFTVANIKNALLGRELGAAVSKPDQGITLLLARAVGARRADGKELRLAPLRAWIDRIEAAAGAGNGAVEVSPARPPEVEPDGGEGPTPVVSRPPLPIEEFARRVLQAARDCPTGRFGEHKVFIAHVRRALASDPDFNGMDDGTFKRRLAQANNARLLDLTRADLVPAMDPRDVRESEVEYYGATFHFIRI
ncbi:hypothetical protein [Tautonia sociabilis]|uniref:Uncharacterized protein n=1 Tax=Tautonia sociabilis TaxID=2080755 RepID=A0A432MI20_9BACT|nr:hypothetical protein [Tautonia sociabilis]RUL86824.1 hypothetical protein TsocGM_15140 [Tautonia sociabilis]